MSNHTPGPWKVAAPKGAMRGAEFQAEDRLIFSADTQHIAEVFQYRNHEHKDADGAALANANLIAAAPDLLKNLKDIVERFVCCAVITGTDREFAELAVAEARAAIAKAEGQ